jgi:nicotinamide riboside kinase
MKNEQIIKLRKLPIIKPRQFDKLKISVLGERNSGKSFVIQEIKKFFQGIHVKEEIMGKVICY